MAHQLRILIVDDEEDILESLRDTLAANLGGDIAVAQATSACAARALLGREAVDLVLSDERMPDGSGTELLGWVNAHHPGVARGLMSAYPDLARRGGGDAEFFVRKPFEMPEVLARIGACLAAHRLTRERPRTPAPPSGLCDVLPENDPHDRST